MATREFADAMRSYSFKDPQGRDTRGFHALRLSEAEIGEFEIYGIEQPYLWLDVTTDEPKKVKMAFQQERRAILDDCMRLKTEVDSYNENFNTGDIIQLELDFSEDVAELEQPVVYQG